MQRGRGFISPRHPCWQIMPIFQNLVQIFWPVIKSSEQQRPIYRQGLTESSRSLRCGQSLLPDRLPKPMIKIAQTSLQELVGGRVFFGQVWRERSTDRFSPCIVVIEQKPSLSANCFRRIEREKSKVAERPNCASRF